MIRQFEPNLRALEVRSPRFGSAYRIGGRLVLTAAHLLDEVGSVCHIRSKQNFGDDDIEAKVVWAASQSDIALIQLPDSIAPCEAIVFGRLPESTRGEIFKFDMFGYPEWAWTRGEQGAEVGGRHIQGNIHLSDTSPYGLLVLEPLRIPSETLSKSASPWTGSSGAAIVCDGLVIAVQRQHQNPQRPASLEASPLWTIYSDEQWCDLLRQNGINSEAKTTSLNGGNRLNGEFEKRINEEASLIRLTSDFISKELRKHPELIDLTINFKPSLVDSPFRNLQPESTDQLSIIEIFEHPNVEGRLLIAGKAGSGKSLLLLQLASVLLEQAKQNTNAPIPLFYDLSLWKNNKSIEICLQEYFSRSKLIEAQTINQWLKDRRKLILFFDGLEQLSLKNQYDCIISINKFIEDYRPEKVVTCIREDEYEQYQQSLILSNAVCIQPLSELQLEKYFHAINCLDRWNLLIELRLTALIQYPSLLSIIKALSDDDIRQIKNRTTLIEKYIFSRNNMGIKEINWLKWIAQQMYSTQPFTFAVDSERQPIFSVTKLQPSMLNRHEYILYVLLNSLLIGLISFVAVFGILSQISWIPFQTSEENSATIVFFALLLAVVSGLFFGKDKCICLPISISYSWNNYEISSRNNECFTYSHLIDNNISIIVIAVGFSVGLVVFLKISSLLILILGFSLQLLSTYIFIDKLEKENSPISSYQYQNNQRLPTEKILLFLNCVFFRYSVGCVFLIRIILGYSIGFIESFLDSGHLDLYEAFRIGSGSSFLFLLTPRLMLEEENKTSQRGPVIAWIQYLTLRIILIRSKNSPLRYNYYLESISKEGLMQRVNQGYKISQDIEAYLCDQAENDSS
jgi:Trypsin-like peptidase domain/NACHT domain